MMRLAQIVGITIGCAAPLVLFDVTGVELEPLEATWLIVAPFARPGNAAPPVAVVLMTVPCTTFETVENTVIVLVPVEVIPVGNCVSVNVSVSLPPV